MLMAGTVVGRIMIPIYRDHPPERSAGDAARLRKLRFGLSGFVLVALAAVAVLGDPLVRLLYDDRYLAAGAMVTAIALAQMPGVVGMTYDQAALVAGNGRGYFLNLAAKATLQTVGFLIGVQVAGLGGALIGQAAALVLAHPLVVMLARKHRVWDGAHDLAFAALALALGGAVLWARWPALIALLHGI
jgi:O-antigen/teichoic acid export membrane protein